MLRRVRAMRADETQRSEAAVELAPPLLPDGAGYRLAEAQAADRSRRVQIERRLGRKARRVARLERLADRWRRLSGATYFGVGAYLLGMIWHQWQLGRIPLGPDTMRLLMALPDAGPPSRFASRLALAMNLSALVLFLAATVARRRWRREVLALGWEADQFSSKLPEDAPEKGP